MIPNSLQILSEFPAEQKLRAQVRSPTTLVVGWAAQISLKMDAIHTKYAGWFMLAGAVNFHGGKGGLCQPEPGSPASSLSSLPACDAWADGENLGERLWVANGRPDGMLHSKLARTTGNHQPRRAASSNYMAQAVNQEHGMCKRDSKEWLARC